MKRIIGIEGEYLKALKEIRVIRYSGKSYNNIMKEWIEDFLLREHGTCGTIKNYKYNYHQIRHGE